MTDDGQLVIEPKIQVGNDAVGNPVLIIDLETPPGYAMSPETVEQLALKFLAAAAHARIRAGALRQMMLEGETELEARRTMERLFPV